MILKVDIESFYFQGLDPFQHLLLWSSDSSNRPQESVKNCSQKKNERLKKVLTAATPERAAIAWYSWPAPRGAAYRIEWTNSAHRDSKERASMSSTRALSRTWCRRSIWEDGPGCSRWCPRLPHGRPSSREVPRPHLVETLTCSISPKSVLWMYVRASDFQFWTKISLDHVRPLRWICWCAHGAQKNDQPLLGKARAHHSVGCLERRLRHTQGKRVYINVESVDLFLRLLLTCNYASKAGHPSKTGHSQAEPLARNACEHDSSSRGTQLIFRSSWGSSSFLAYLFLRFYYGKKLVVFNF